MEKNRYHDLDALRSFAMLLGIVLHGLLSFIPTPIWAVQDIKQSEFFGIPLMFIHGFRMSLFFFISGFFTMMTWQTKGTKRLLAHRSKRIILPFVVSGILIFPMLNNMWAFADWVGEEIEERIDRHKESEDGFDKWDETPIDLGGAARKGDLGKIQEFLERGEKVNARYDKNLTPLHWAAAMNRVDAIELLLEYGAEIDSRDGHLSTPLLVASFFGRSESVAALLEKGANPKLTNKDGTLPVQVIMSSKAITEWVAKDLLNVPIVWSKVVEGRRKSARLLMEQGDSIDEFGMRGNEPKKNWFTRNYFLMGQFCTHHLWFLYYLIFLIVGFVVLEQVFRFMPLSGMAKWLAVSPMRLLWLTPLTFLAQYNMGEGGEDGTFGPVTAVFLEPNWIKLSYYGLFFGYGAVCFPHREFHDKIGRFWPIHIILAVLLFVVAIKYFEDKEDDGAYAIISFCSSLFAWLMIFGLIGLFRRFFSNQNLRIRFLSDSAFWIYLAHLPLVQLIQLWVSDWALPALFKLLLVCVLSTLLLLVSYRLFVRYTWVGTMLNGKRIPNSHKA